MNPNIVFTPMLQFTGKERDAETGLDFFGARYYSGAQGRFTGPDPLLNSGRPDNPQSWNRYSYGLNNPLRKIDPSGLYEWEQSVGVCHIGRFELWSVRKCFVVGWPGMKFAQSDG